MREYFRGWKRKVGVFALVLACVFLAGWVRSLMMRDMIRIPVGNAGGIELVSVNQTLFKCYYSSAFPSSWHTTRIPADKWDGWDRIWDIKWLWRGYGFGLGNGTGTLQGRTVIFSSVVIVAAPYWSLVLPLTLISAWLLLSKPRPAKPPAIETVE